MSEKHFWVGWGCLVAAVLGFIFWGGIAQGANEDEHQLKVIATGYLYHNGTPSGVSEIWTSVPANAVAVQAFVQAVGYDARFTYDRVSDAFDASSGTSGWMLEENKGLELISQDQIEAWGFGPSNGHTTGVTIQYVIEGRD